MKVVESLLYRPSHMKSGLLSLIADIDYPTITEPRVGLGVGFSRSADRMALFLVTSNPRWRPAAIFENFE